MKIRLKNYCDEWSEHDIGETSDIVFAILRELSGDEVLTVYRSGNRTGVFDSDTNGRTTDYDDGSCVVFSEGKWDEEFLREHEVKDLAKGAEPDVVSPKKAPDAEAKDEPKRTRITNAEKYRTAEERAKAFNCFCSGKSCGECVMAEHNKPYSVDCCMAFWLEREYDEEDVLPCPFCGGSTALNVGHLMGNVLRHWVDCTDPKCMYRSGHYNDRKDAIAGHNRVARWVMEAKKEGADQ